MVWKDLKSSGDADDLSECVLIIDEASSLSPRLGRDLLLWRASAVPASRTEAWVFQLAGLAGTVTHVFEAGARAARSRGLFSSSIMGFRDVQERLAGLAAGAELLRLGTIRVCRLMDRGAPELAQAEIGPLLDKGRALVDEARSLALALLGEAWTRGHLPEGGPLSANERIRT